MSQARLSTVFLLMAAPLAAQRVPVTLTASLTNEAGKVLPVSGRFWFVPGGGGDSVLAVTDGTGTARLELSAGAYQVRSHEGASLGGRSFYWDVPVTVGGPVLVELTLANAQTTAPSGDVIVMGAPEQPKDAGSRRRGFWIGFGPAIGYRDCNGCDSLNSVGGFSIHLGGTVSPYLRIGVSSDTWFRESDDVYRSQSNLTAVLMFFPSTTLGFRFTAGVGASGIGRYDHNDESEQWESGVGYILGFAYEGMVAKKFALAPYVSFLGGSFDHSHANFWLFGLAATWP